MSVHDSRSKKKKAPLDKRISTCVAAELLIAAIFKSYIQTAGRIGGALGLGGHGASGLVVTVLRNLCTIQ